MSNPSFAWLEVEPCITCGAEPNHSCVTVKGATPGKPTPPHAERLFIGLAKRQSRDYIDIVDR